MEIKLTRKQGGFLVDAAFEGPESGVTALFGPSGAGKTSLISMVAGLMHPDAGRIQVNGLCLFDSERHINLPPEKRRIGYVFQDGRLLPHLSVRGNLTYGMRLTPANRRFVAFDAVVELLGIGHLLSRRPARLSGGEKQRVAIGRALLTSPAMLLMDEPLASLDASRKSEVLPFIMRLSREYAIPILYVSHIMDEILNLADRLVIMDMGRVAAFGDLDDLLSRPELQPHLGTEDYGSVISAVVDEPLDASGLTRLRFGGHWLKVPPMPAGRGDQVRVRISARHVAVALRAPEQSSFQNIFPGKLDQIFDRGEPFVDLRLDIGCPLLARISRKSFSDLNLKPGQPVFALVKSVAVSLGAVHAMPDESKVPPI
ncbi:molybdate transporter subunit; ATP-binding component of ABC superfamily [uncultured Desulfatiglans sp.]|uniref:Molybdate transporter subunit ATP-binding component of ABC superfamily n=1 Tax=Uncultured Desulfatiglans sp. TaxID=1748965 RepID=A0A653A9E1_UNCDX|nr:molybdate transporter subunit; ATP-binding component of ABC superfamily [uncultured Desulfatiglans sp.]